MVLIFVGIFIAVLSAFPTIDGAQNQSFALCQLSGDPRLLPFALQDNSSLNSSPCALRNAPVPLFRNRFIRIEVVNNGGSLGYIVSAHNYNIDVQTSWENAKQSKGLCHDGCVSGYMTNVRSALASAVPEDQTTSSLAQQICDIYLKEYIKPNAPVPIPLIQYVQSTHQGCITDVRNMGDKGYAEQALISIITTIMTFNATSLEQIEIRTQQATELARQLSQIADHKTKNPVIH